MSSLTPVQQKTLKCIYRQRNTRSFTCGETDAFDVRTAKALERRGLIEAKIKQSDLSWQKRWVLTDAGLLLGSELCSDRLSVEARVRSLPNDSADRTNEFEILFCAGS